MNYLPVLCAHCIVDNYGETAVDGFQDGRKVVNQHSQIVVRPIHFQLTHNAYGRHQSAVRHQTDDKDDGYSGEHDHQLSFLFRDEIFLLNNVQSFPRSSPSPMRVGL
ncbi:hypothetical protein BgiBS90_013516 [Biomphalaria glabrata]|nr:hypothetical protein BgiBS90_013516 [Biomphalaria glabrata]